MADQSSRPDAPRPGGGRRTEDPLEAVLTLLERGFVREARQLLESALELRPNDARLRAAIKLLPERLAPEDPEDLPQRRALPVELELEHEEASQRFRGWLESGALIDADGAPTWKLPASMPHAWIGLPPPMSDEEADALQTSMGWRPARSVRPFSPRRPASESRRPPALLRQRRYWPPSPLLLVTGTAILVVALLIPLVIAIESYVRVFRLDRDAERLYTVGDFDGALARWGMAEVLGGFDDERGAQMRSTRQQRQRQSRLRTIATNLDLAQELDRLGQWEMAIRAYHETLREGLPAEQQEAVLERIAALEQLVAAELERSGLRDQQTRKTAAELWERARESFDQALYEQAETLLIEVVRLQPGRIEAFDLLRAARQGAEQQDQVRIVEGSPQASISMAVAGAGKRSPAAPAIPTLGRAELEGSIQQLLTRRQALLRELTAPGRTMNDRTRSLLVGQLREIQESLQAYRRELRLLLGSSGNAAAP